VSLFNWLFRVDDDASGIVNRNTKNSAQATAKDRMRNMLTHDRLELPAGRLQILEEELMAVVSRYFDLDKETTHFDLQQFDRKAALIANFRLIRSKC